MPDFSTSAFSSNLNGLVASTWFSCLRENHFRVDRPYRLRAGVVSLFSILNSIVAFAESTIYGTPLDRCEPRPPVFILGHWRTGTTFLHNLMALDSRYVAPNMVQTMFPHTFLLLESPLKFLISPFIPANRLIDNMEISVSCPQEDEFALAALTGKSPYLAYSFPGNWQEYDKHISMADVSEQERLAWASALEKFLRKLTFRNDKTPLLKSPAHTARIQGLLTRFPEAKFIHLSRHPFDIFRSMRKMMSIGPAMTQLQRFDFNDVDQIILQRFCTINDAYLQQRSMIPPGNLCEIRFEDLESSTLTELERMYDALGLTGYGESRSSFVDYLNKIQGYKRTVFSPLMAAEKDQIRDRWGRYFEAFGY